MQAGILLRAHLREGGGQGEMPDLIDIMWD